MEEDILQGTIDDLDILLRFKRNDVMLDFSGLNLVFNVKKGSNYIHPREGWDLIKQELGENRFEEYISFRLFNENRRTFYDVIEIDKDDESGEKIRFLSKQEIVIPASCNGSLYIFQQGIKANYLPQIHIQGPIENYRLIFRKNISLKKFPEEEVLEKTINELFNIASRYAKSISMFPPFFGIDIDFLKETFVNAYKQNITYNITEIVEKNLSVAVQESFLFE